MKRLLCLKRISQKALDRRQNDLEGIWEFACQTRFYLENTMSGLKDIGEFLDPVCLNVAHCQII